MTWFIQLTFLSVGFWLLDIPHKFLTGVKRCCHERKQRNAKRKVKFVDTYAFDLGFHSSYALTSYVIALLFAAIVPYVTFVAVPFFALKYLVDKYNLSFVYNTEFKGVGRIKQKI